VRHDGGPVLVPRGPMLHNVPGVSGATCGRDHGPACQI